MCGPGLLCLTVTEKWTSSPDESVALVLGKMSPTMITWYQPLQTGLHLKQLQYFMVLLMLYPWMEECGFRPMNTISNMGVLKEGSTFIGNDFWQSLPPISWDSIITRGSMFR